MELYLKSLEFKFSFIGLTETWLDIDKEELYDFIGYTIVTNIGQIGRVVVSHFIFYRVLLLH